VAEPDSAEKKAGRFTTAQKTAAVMRLLKGGAAEEICGEYGISVMRLERWHNRFVEGGASALAKRKHSSESWWTKHAGAAWQWVWLVILLSLMVGAMVIFMQRGSGE
jgi:hypothetical protein